jgi:GNAT superfamily N-acetyltransferase
MSVKFEIIDITPENEKEYDLFCKKSKKKEEGYQAKLSWFQERFREGLRMKVLYVNDRGKMTSRGFIEYIPGEYSWRVVNAPNYLVIHCLWVVGQWKKKGFGRMLLNACLDDAKQNEKAGVAAVTNEGTWATNRKIFLKNGFELVDNAPLGFELLVKRFGDSPLPSFPTNWDARLKQYGEGLTVFYSAQCPYQPDAVKILFRTAVELGWSFRSVELKTAKEVQEKSPSAYGVFSVVYNGRLLSYTYLKKDELLSRVSS